MNRKKLELLEWLVYKGGEKMASRDSQYQDSEEDKKSTTQIGGLKAEVSTKTDPITESPTKFSDTLSEEREVT